MTVLYGGAEEVCILVHPKTGTIHHAQNLTAGETQCGRWLPSSASDVRSTGDVERQRHRLCKRCWVMSWFEEAPSA
jgi:hypothetical protein